MKLTIIMTLLFVMVAIIAGLFFIEIPAGNEKAAHVALGAVTTVFIQAVSDFLGKKEH
jgi:hypothetical protein